MVMTVNDSAQSKLMTEFGSLLGMVIFYLFHGVQIFRLAAWGVVYRYAGLLSPHLHACMHTRAER